MDERFLGKVVALITRARDDGPELLLFQHPHAGIQLPAGTVEEGEAPSAAALREAQEETGLDGLALLAHIGSQVTTVPEHRFVLRPTRVTSRPDEESFDWAALPRGVMVRRLRQDGAFVQVRYQEWDRLPDSRYVTYAITGWVRRGVLAEGLRRHFFHLLHTGETPSQWTVAVDNHRFRLFWAELDALPELEPLQAQWLAQVQDVLGYDLARATPR